MKNIPIEWKVFDYKFASNPRTAFENLSYALFCIEFHIEYGAFRYFNQPYIETEPVDTHDGFITGFQAKYYDPQTTISSKEQELKETISKAKKKYTNISRLIIYTNKELSSSSSKDKVKPQYQVNIEKQGIILGIKIEWRVKSNFEIILQKEDATILRDLYFNPEPGVQKYLSLIQSRSNSILESIQSDIRIDDYTIKLPHPHFDVLSFLASNESVCIVYGGAGTGKSGFIKDQAQQIQEKYKDTVLVSFSASDFDAEDNEHVLLHGEYSFEDFLNGYNDSKSKICFIESAEKYWTFQKPAVFKKAINELILHGWKLIITIREPYLASFCGAILDNSVSYNPFQIKSINPDILRKLSGKYGFSLPEDNRLKDLLCNLFYLKLYLSIIKTSEDTSITIEAFTDLIWRQVIRNESVKTGNLPAKREKLIIDIVFHLFNKDSYVYKSNYDDDWESINSLAESGIISLYNNDGDLWVLNHDIYEEIVCNHILSDRFSEGQDINGLISGFGESFRCRKMFRIWLETRLKYAGEDICDFILNTFQGDFKQSWKDETIIAVISSSNENALAIIESMMSLNEYEFFSRTVFLLNTACRKVDIEFLKLINQQEINNYRFTKPFGEAWNTIFSYINKHHSTIPWTQANLNIVNEALYSWASSYPRGKTTRLVGQIALQLKSKWINKEIEQTYRYNNETESTIDKIILESAFEIKQDLEQIINDIISMDEINHRIDHYNLMEKSLSNKFDSGKIALAIPSSIIKLAKAYWLFTANNNHFSSFELADYFGLNENMSYNYYPSSAFQTPVLYLLYIDFKESIDFIIEIMNESAKNYRDSSLNTDYSECQEIEIKLSEEETIKQIASYRLWNIHRGTGVAPDLLCSILMALEKYLLEQFMQISDEQATGICIYLLRESNNVAITSLVLSLVIAFPDKLFDISCILLRTKEVFDYDLNRFQKEIEANFCRIPQGEWKNYNDERIQSNSLPFRKKRFEDVILNYQIQTSNNPQDVFEKRCRIIHNCIDSAKEGIEKWDPIYQFAYYRMDTRSLVQTGDPIEEDGKTLIPLESKFPQHLEAIREKHMTDSEEYFDNNEIMLWAVHKYKGDESYKGYKGYDANPIDALKDTIKLCADNQWKHGYSERIAVINTAAVMLRDYSDLMNTDEKEFCEEIILTSAYDYLNNSPFQYNSDEKKAIFNEVARMAVNSDYEHDRKNPCFLMVAIILDSMKRFDHLFSNPLSVLWQQNEHKAYQIIGIFIELIPQYKRKDIISYVSSHKKAITKRFSSSSRLSDIDVDRLNYNELMYLTVLMDNNDDSQLEFILKIGKHLWKNMFPAIDDYKINKNYQLETSYMFWLSDYILNISEDQQNDLVQGLLPFIKMGREFNDLLTYIIMSQNNNPRYLSFWNLWSLLQDFIITSFEKDKDFYSDPSREIILGLGREDIILTFLLTRLDMDQSNIEFRSIRSKLRTFYTSVSSRIGFNPTTLLAIAQMLNTSGKKEFEEDGVKWLSMIIAYNPHLTEVPLHTNTLYYMEEYIFSYVKKRNFSFRDNTDAKKRIMIVLDFLVSKGSTIGFLLREEIL